MRRFVLLCLLGSTGLLSLGCRVSPDHTTHGDEPVTAPRPVETTPTTHPHDHAPPPRTPEN